MVFYKGMNIIFTPRISMLLVINNSEHKSSFSYDNKRYYIGNWGGYVKHQTVTVFSFPPIF